METKGHLKAEMTGQPASKPTPVPSRTQVSTGFKITSSWASLINSKVVKDDPDSLYLGVNRHFFRNCLRPFLMAIRVDAEWYLNRHKDVRKAIDDGMIRNAQDHYIRFGFFENRMPYAIQVDERWYASAYADVKAAIESGTFSSAQHHFDVIGYAEGRQPYPDFSLELTA